MFKTFVNLFTCTIRMQMRARVIRLSAIPCSFCFLQLHYQISSIDRERMLVFIAFSLYVEMGVSCFLFLVSASFLCGHLFWLIFLSRLIYHLLLWLGHYG